MRNLPNLLVVGNRGPFRVTPRVIGVYCERVTRMQFGKWMDPVHPLGTWILISPWGAGLCCSNSITRSQLLLQSASATSVPIHLLLQPHSFCLLKCFAFWRRIFTTPASRPLSASAFLSDDSFILCILPFQFPRENLIGLPNYQIE